MTEKYFEGIDLTEEEKISAEYFINAMAEYSDKNTITYVDPVTYQKSVEKKCVMILNEFLNQIASRNYNKDIRILDYGCGTGIISQNLNKQGHTNIDGVDGSKEFVEYAKSLNIMKNVDCMYLANEKSTEFLKGKYDVAISKGCFLTGHIEIKEGLEEIKQIFNPESKVKEFIFNIREYDAEYCIKTRKI